MKDKAPLSILLLAAGGSTRYGSPKQLLAFQGKPLVCHLVDVALQSKANAVHVVLGAEAEKIRQVLAGIPVQVVVNEQWQEGIGSSVRVGVQALSETAEAVLIMLGDQPLVTPAHLNALIDAFHSTGKPIVASAYAETLGVPALFGRRYFPDLQNLSGKTGAKEIILHHKEEVVGIPFPDGEVGINSHDDYQRVLSRQPPG